MKNFVRLVIGAALIFELGACASNQANNPESKSGGAATEKKDFSQYGKLLTGDEIKNAFSGAKFAGKNQYKVMGAYWDWVCEYGKDGVAKCKSGPYKDSGPWTVEDGKICAKFNSFHGGQKYCNFVRLKDGVYTSHNDVRLEDVFKAEK